MTASRPATLSCPNCGSARFSPSGQVVTLDGTLHDWEVQGQLTFPQAVWDDYAQVLKDDLVLHRCDDCTFRQFVPPLAGTNAFYRAITSGETAYYTQDRWEFRQAIATLKRAGSHSVLDAGCGAGAFLQQLKAAGVSDVTGYDFNSDTPRVLAEKGIAALSSLAEDGERTFDAVTCFQVLEHLDDPWSFGQALRQRVKPGGVVILTTPDADGPIRHFTASVTDLPPHHVARWNGASMRAFAEKLGFIHVRTRREPLPSYVWRYYLPVMIRKSGLPEIVKANLLAHDRVLRFLGWLERLGVRELPPLPGHTLYGEFRAP
jgi:SAM-dependent methyltransferase